MNKHLSLGRAARRGAGNGASTGAHVSSAASRGTSRLVALPLAVLVSAVLGACSLAPHYDRPAAPVSPSFPGGDAYKTNGVVGNGVAAADIGWQDVFIDVRLKAIIALALKNNRDLRVAVLNVATARAQFQVERAALLPTFNVSAADNRTRTPGNLTYTGRPTLGSEYTAVGNASWELDLFGRVKSLSNAALATYFSTAQARKATEISLVAQVANQYLTVRAYDAQLLVTQNTLKTAGESYRIAKLQFDNGVGDALDLKQAEGIVDQAQSNLQDQIRSRAQAVNALVLLVGAPLPDDLPQPLPLDQQNIIADIPAGVPSDLLTRRPDIIEAEQTLLADNASIGAARAAFFPSISITGSAGAASSDLGRLFKAGQAYWTFAPQINIPIFSGGENTANLDIAKVRKNIGIANYEKAIQTAFREVSDSLAARGTYDDQINALQRYVASQQNRLDLSNLRYTNGVDSYLSVLTAQTDLYSAQQMLVTAQMDRATNLVLLYQRLGGGWLERTGDQPRPADSAPDYANVDKNGTPLPDTAKHGG
ncbi:MAG: efflux transporter outer membrane subunit [Janthinobacterium lividum]